jgi:hypothetical protein
MVRATVHDLALFRQVLAPGAQRVLYRAHRAIEHGAHFLPFIAYELCDRLPALRRVRFSGGERASDPFRFGDIADCAPEASALAIRARRPSRRSSAVGLGCSSVVAILRLPTCPDRREETTRVSFSAIAILQAEPLCGL